MDTDHGEYLFVYGSLRHDTAAGQPHPMHRVVASHCRFVGTGRCRGQLFELGGYPGLVLSSRAGAPVRGEIYRVDNPGALWPILDAYEDCDPGQPTLSEYRREKIPVTAGPGRTLAAWTYLYNGPVAGRRRILSGDYARLS